MPRLTSWRRCSTTWNLESVSLFRGWLDSKVFMIFEPLGADNFEARELLVAVI